MRWGTPHTTRVWRLRGKARCSPPGSAGHHVRAWRAGPKAGPRQPGTCPGARHPCSRSTSKFSLSFGQLRQAVEQHAVEQVVYHQRHLHETFFWEGCGRLCNLPLPEAHRIDAVGQTIFRGEVGMCEPGTEEGPFPRISTAVLFGTRQLSGSNADTPLAPDVEEWSLVELRGLGRPVFALVGVDIEAPLAASIGTGGYPDKAWNRAHGVTFEGLGRICRVGEEHRALAWWSPPDRAVTAFGQDAVFDPLRVQQTLLGSNKAANQRLQVGLRHQSPRHDFRTPLDLSDL